MKHKMRKSCKPIDRWYQLKGTLKNFIKKVTVQL